MVVSLPRLRTPGISTKRGYASCKASSPKRCRHVPPSVYMVRPVMIASPVLMTLAAPSVSHDHTLPPRFLKSRKMILQIVASLGLALVLVGCPTLGDTASEREDASMTASHPSDNLGIGSVTNEMGNCYVTNLQAQISILLLLVCAEEHSTIGVGYNRPGYGGPDGMQPSLDDKYFIMVWDTRREVVSAEEDIVVWFTPTRDSTRTPFSKRKGTIDNSVLRAELSRQEAEELLDQMGSNGGSSIYFVIGDDMSKVQQIALPVGLDNLASYVRKVIHEATN